MRGMILCAGYGTRLWPLTENRAKAAIPILGKPLVAYVAEYLASYGCRQTVVNLHHQPESVRAALGDGSRFGIDLQYIEEPVILGTSGALDNARHLLEGDTLVVVNGKIITDIDLDTAFETHKQKEALATLVLVPNKARERFSMVEISDGLVKRFGGMPSPAGTPGSSSIAEVPLMFTGIQILESRIFDYIPRGVFSHSTIDVYPQALAKGERIAAHVAAGKWYELSTIQRYLDISLKMLFEQGDNVTFGAGCSVSEGTDIVDAILWENVTVEPGARIHRAVIGDGVHVRSGELIEDAVVVPTSLISGKVPPAKALKGRFQGDNFVVTLRG